MKAELSRADIELVTRDFFSDPFTREEIEDLFHTREISDFFSFRSPSFKKTGLDRSNLTRNHMIDLMVAEPRLIKRPLISYQGDIFLGNDKKSLANMLQNMD